MVLLEVDHHKIIPQPLKDKLKIAYLIQED